MASQLISSPTSISMDSGTILSPQLLLSPNSVGINLINISQSPGEKRERGKNFSTHESACLAKCWLAISCDSEIGTDQNASTFWDRILAMWEQAKEKDCLIAPRTVQSLQSHWSDCSKSVQKFSGFFNKLMNDLPSGCAPVKLIYARKANC